MGEGRRCRIAVCSPLPPAASGVADFAAAQAVAVAELGVEVRAYHPRSAPAAAVPGVPTAPLDRLDGDGPFDGLLIHLGNHSGHHGELLGLALERPSVVVLHEVDLRHLVVGATLGAGDPAGLLRLLHRGYGSAGEAAGRRWLEQGAAAGLRELPLFEPVVDASRGIVVHTAWAHDRVLASRPDAAVRVVPHLLPEVPKREEREEMAAAFRQRVGIATGAPLVGVFGFVTASKRLPRVLRAFALVRRQMPSARLVVVGDRSPDPSVDELLAGPLGDGVTATGRVPLDELHASMAAADMAVSLRHPPGGEASGTALRLLALGLPLVVSVAGWCAEIPEGAAVHVPPDADEVETLAASMLTLLENDDLRRTIGENGRRWAVAHHDPVCAARKILDALLELSRLEPLWPAVAGRPSRRRLPDAELLEGAGRAMAELGVDERDDGLVGEITRRAAELGVDP